MELYVLPLGDCCCNYEVIAPGIADGKRIHIPVPGYLVRLDDNSLLLIDTGMHRLHISDLLRVVVSGPRTPAGSGPCRRTRPGRCAGPAAHSGRARRSSNR